jgi:hypothetical protein
MMFVPATISNDEKLGLPIVCHFAPETLTIMKSNRWPPQRGQGQKLDPPQFAGVTPGKLKMKLWFDSTELPGRDVKGDIKDLLKLMEPDDFKKTVTGDRTTTEQHRPPVCTFQWGATLSFKCVLMSATVTFLLFDNSGRPLRATADCVFQQVMLEESFGFQNPTSGGRTGERYHRLAPRETLEHVAYNSFGKTSLWRAVAAFNGIDDPLRLQAGDTILLPASVDDLKEFA